MINLSEVTQARSDQLNNVDLITGAKVIKITGVKHGTNEQKLTISYEGDNGKPWKPCLTMIRLLAEVWKTGDGDDFVGRSVKLYRDPDIKFGRDEPGGIRISHVSDITSQVKVTLPVSKGRCAKFVVDPILGKPLKPLSDDDLKLFTAEMEGCEEMADLELIGKKIGDGGFDAEGNKQLKAIYRDNSKRIREQK